MPGLGIALKREADALLAYPAGLDALVAAAPSEPRQPRMARMLAHDEASTRLVQALQDGVGTEVPLSHPYLLGLGVLQQWHHDSSLTLVRVLAGCDAAHQGAVRDVDHQRVARRGCSNTSSIHCAGSARSKVRRAITLTALFQHPSVHRGIAENPVPKSTAVG